MNTNPRRWDRAELATIVDDLLNITAALEQWLSGSGVSGTPPKLVTTPTPPPLFSMPRQHEDLSASELARVINVGRSTILQWCRQGTLASYSVPSSGPAEMRWMIPVTEARKAASFASELRTTHPRMTDRSVAILTSRHLRSTKGLPPLGRKGRR